MGAGVANLAPMSPGEARAMAVIMQRPVAISGGQGLVAYPDGTIGTLGGGGIGAGGSVGAAPAPSAPGRGYAAGTGAGPYTAPAVAAPAPAVPSGANWPGGAPRSATTGNWPVPPTGGGLGNLLSGLRAWLPSGGAMLPANIPPQPGGNWPAQGGSTSPGNWPGAAAQPAPGYVVGTGVGPYDQPQTPAAQPASGFHAGTGAGPYDPQQFIAHHARVYRVAHGMGTQADADALNAMSLAAERAGRTTFNPGLASLYGRGDIPGFNVVNALAAPSTTQVAQGAPVSLLPPQWQANNLNYLANQQANLGQG